MSDLDDFIKQIDGKSEDEIMEMIDNEYRETNYEPKGFEITSQGDYQKDSYADHRKDSHEGKGKGPHDDKEKDSHDHKGKDPHGDKEKGPHDNKEKGPHDDKENDPHDDRERASCKKWFAKVFTYCRNDQLEGLTNDFLDKINEDYRLKDFSFKPEETVFLGCTCPGGRKQTILYFTFTRERNPNHHDHK